MRIVYVDEKHSIEEPDVRFPSLVDAIAALDRLFKEGRSSFGQILTNDGAILQNLVPSTTHSAVTQETTAPAVQ
jgi:hypothetical protein